MEVTTKNFIQCIFELQKRLDNKEIIKLATKRLNKEIKQIDDHNFIDNFKDLLNNVTIKLHVDNLHSSKGKKRKSKKDTSDDSDDNLLYSEEDNLDTKSILSNGKKRKSIPVKKYSKEEKQIYHNVNDNKDDEDYNNETQSSTEDEKELRKYTTETSEEEEYIPSNSDSEEYQPNKKKRKKIKKPSKKRKNKKSEDTVQVVVESENEFTDNSSPEPYRPSSPVFNNSPKKQKTRKTNVDESE